jgi:two-component system sensor histidine kinase AlgZ
MLETRRTGDPLTLPDLCSPGAMVVHLLLGALIALILTLGGDGWLDGFWISFGLTLLFVQWAILITVLLLCRVARAGLVRSVWLLSILFPLIASFVTTLSTLLLSWGGWLLTDLPTGWLALRNGLLAALLAFAFARYLVLQADWRARVATDSRARLDALQARIHPHFLFNALNTVSELVHRQPQQAEDALLDLSDLLRSGLRVDSEHTLKEELDLIRAYLRIEALRLGDRLKVVWSIDEHIDMNQVRPALLIQPLVENAVIHGIAPCPDGGELKITLSMIRFGRIRVRVENPLPPDPAHRRAGNGTALDNIRQRLALAYEEGAGLKTDRLGSIFRATLTLPAGKTRVRPDPAAGPG